MGLFQARRHVNLPTAENDTLDGFRLVDRLAVLGIGEDPPEVRLASESVQVRASNGVPEKRFRTEDDKGCERISEDSKRCVW